MWSKDAIFRNVMNFRSEELNLMNSIVMIFFFKVVIYQIFFMHPRDNMIESVNRGYASGLTLDQTELVL